MPSAAEEAPDARTERISSMRKNPRDLLSAIPLLFVVLLMPRDVYADNFSFSTSLPVGNSVAFYEFTVQEQQSVFLLTTSYASDGGFDPMLTVFDTDGFWVTSNDNNSPGFDSQIFQSLPSGRYTLAVTQAGNVAVADGQPSGQLADGFTGAAPLDFGGRNGSVTVDILNVDGAVQLKAGDVALVPPDSDRFLRFRNEPSPAHRETEESANSYYAAVDPGDTKLTLSAWIQANGFASGDDAEAIYVNDADLGFGRHMHIKATGDDFASYVENFSADVLDPSDPGAGPVDEKVANAHNDTNLLATVAMEYSAHPNDPSGQRYTKFYIFDGNGDRINKIDLDGRGAKYLPGACNVCHGGNPTPLDDNGDYVDFGNTGARFLPWDLDVLGFSDSVAAGQYSRANQEAALRDMNLAILDKTNPTDTTRTLVEGWYGGAGLPNPEYDGSYVPTGWESDPNYYLEVYGPNCRACHIMRNDAVDFDSAAELRDFAARTQKLVFQEGVMPLAKRTFERFWTLPVGTLELVSKDTQGLQSSASVFSELALSSSGRHAVYSDGDVHLKDLATGELSIVSTNASGDLSDATSEEPAVSDDGRYVVFESYASNLVTPDANNASEIFLKDTQTGAISVMSSSSTGVRAANSSQNSTGASISDDGRFVAFSSSFDGLVGSDTNGAFDAFLKDSQTGVTTRVSTNSAGSEANGFSFAEAISADGRFVLFRSNATNLGGSTSGVIGIYRKDTQTGAVVLVSSDDAGVPANANSTQSSLSDDGRYAVFTSTATNLSPAATSGIRQAYWKDLDTGEIRLASSDHDGQAGNDSSDGPDVSDDGRYVVFDSSSTNLTSRIVALADDVFLKDVDSGEIKRVSVDEAGVEVSGGKFRPAMSGDGRRIVFSSNSANLVPVDSNGTTNDVFLYDRDGSTAAASNFFSAPGNPPGSGGPNPFAGTERIAITALETLLNSDDSSMVSAQDGETGYLWELTSVPAGSSVSLSSANANTSFTPDVPGNYIARLVTKNGTFDAFGETNNDSVEIFVSNDGSAGAESVDFASEVVPIFNDNCAICHGDASAFVAPKFDAPVVSTATEALYRSFYARTDLLKPINSLLLEKTLGGFDHGGGAVFASVMDDDYVKLRDWVEQGSARHPLLPKPSYSRFANALELPGGDALVASHNFNAGVEPGEPDHANVSGGNSAWFEWTPDVSGTYSFTVTSSQFDSLIAVYTGQAVDALTVVGFNDDGPGTSDSELSLQVAAGQTYYVAVDSHGGVSGTFDFEIVLTSAVSVPALGPRGSLILLMVLGAAGRWVLRGKMRTG